MLTGSALQLMTFRQLTQDRYWLLMSQEITAILGSLNSLLTMQKQYYYALRNILLEECSLPLDCDDFYSQIVPRDLYLKDNVSNVSILTIFSSESKIFNISSSFNLTFCVTQEFLIFEHILLLNRPSYYLIDYVEGLECS